MTRAWVALGSTLLFAGCLPSYGYYLQPCPTGSAFECYDQTVRDQAAAAGDIETSLFLVGDAGEFGDGRRSFVLDKIAEGLAEAVPDKRVVYLGDNIYPDGLRPGSHPDCHSWTGDGPYCPEDREQLDAQLSILSVDVPGYFVPGNHDWADTRSHDGYTMLWNQDQYLRNTPGRMLPEAGCPGPVRDFAVGTGEVRAHLIFIDTHWLILPNGSRPQTFDEASVPPPPDCEIEKADDVYPALARMLEDAGDLPVIVMGHHPTRTHGRHGGFANGAYPFGFNSQDINSTPYRRLIRNLEATLAGRSSRAPVVYAAGHDHVLQVLRDDAGVVHLVSGSGSKDASGVAAGPDTEFAAGLPGFMRLDFHENGDVFLYVYAGCHIDLPLNPELGEPTCGANEFAVVHAMKVGETTGP